MPVAVFAPSIPVWVDLASPDVEGSKAFYTKLFGWEIRTIPDPAAGGYTFFTLRGKQVAGVGPVQDPNQPPAWSMYVGTEDADATARAVREAGGRVVVEPFDVMNAGRMAVFTDPAGAFFSVWQAGEHKGAEVTQEPNTLAWAELLTRDIEGAKGFYKKVFGWGSKTSAVPPATPASPPAYTEWQLGGKSIAGGMAMTDQIPANVPSNWTNYFAVGDVDAAAKKAQGLGAKALVPPSDYPGGRFAVLSDPQGAVFALLFVKP